MLSMHHTQALKNGARPGSLPLQERANRSGWDVRVCQLLDGGGKQTPRIVLSRSQPHDDGTVCGAAAGDDKKGMQKLDKDKSGEVEADEILEYLQEKQPFDDVSQRDTQGACARELVCVCAAAGAWNQWHAQTRNRRIARRLVQDRERMPSSAPRYDHCR